MVCSTMILSMRQMRKDGMTASAIAARGMSNSSANVAVKGC